MSVRFCHIVLMLCSLCTVASCGKTTEIESLVTDPEAVFVHEKEGVFEINTEVGVFFDGLSQNSSTARMAVATLRRMHFKPQVLNERPTNGLTFFVYREPNEELGDEGYLIDIRPGGIRLSANTEVGLFYACQSLYSLMPDDIMRRRYRRIAIPCGVILDYPTTSWRQADLSAANSQSITHVRHVIDSVARIKVNRLVWHLCDSSRWLVQSLLYPQIETFFSMEDVDDLVSYAASRHVELVPSVDNPQCCAALATAFPSMTCTDACGSQLCLGHDSLEVIVVTLLDELLDRFASDYFFVACDATGTVTDCDRSVRRMRRLGLSNGTQLFGHYSHALKYYLQQHARHTAHL